MYTSFQAFLGVQLIYMCINEIKFSNTTVKKRLEHLIAVSMFFLNVSYKPSFLNCFYLGYSISYHSQVTDFLNCSKYLYFTSYNLQ